MRRGAGIALLLGLAALPATMPSKFAAAGTDGPAVRAWLTSGDPAKSLDIVFVGDGYQKKHLGPEGKYWTDVKRYATRLMTEPPFSWYRARVNVKAVFLESQDEGCDDRPKPKVKRTALGSHFDGPGGRLLAFEDEAALAKALTAAGSTDIAFVMVNTETYGGAGTSLYNVKVRGRPLPAPTFAAQDTASFLIALHELGHSFAGLADEYTEISETANYPLPKDGSDLPDPNATVADHVDRTSPATVQKTVKWKHFIDLPGGAKRTWLYEGCYYRAAGVFRPWEKCRMRDHADPYCPVCCEEMAKGIVAACADTWDDAAFPKAHPLSLWK